MTSASAGTAARPARTESLRSRPPSAISTGLPSPAATPQAGEAHDVRRMQDDDDAGHLGDGREAAHRVADDGLAGEQQELLGLALGQPHPPALAGCRDDHPGARVGRADHLCSSVSLLQRRPAAAAWSHRRDTLHPGPAHAFAEHLGRRDRSRAAARQGGRHGAGKAVVRWPTTPPSTAKTSGTISTATTPAADPATTRTLGDRGDLLELGGDDVGGRRGADFVEHGVEEGVGLVFVHVAGVHELAREDLLGLREHLLLAGREALVAVPDGEVAHDLGDLEDVAGLELVAVVLVAPAPVLGHLRGVAVQHRENLVDHVGGDDLAQAGAVGGVDGDHDGHVVVQDLDGEVLAQLTADFHVLDLHDLARAVMRVDDLIADSVQDQPPPGRLVLWVASPLLGRATTGPW